MSAQLLNRDQTPWYRQGWPWFLMALPATAVVAGLITLWIAISTDEGQVIADYYKQGRAVHESLERVEHAAALGLKADVRLTADRVRIALDASDRHVLPRTLLVTIARPADGTHDQILRLSGDEGLYEGAVAELGLGHWRIYLEDESRSWRLNGATYLPNQSEFRILPPEPVRR